jgi:type IV pilus assembly protein PilC
MPRFRYEAKKGPGESQTGVMDAESERAVAAQLRDLGFIPVSVTEEETESKRDTLRHALIRIRLKDRNVFFRQLANLYESGMPLTRGLNTIANQTVNPKMVAVVERLREDVQKGSTFAEALEQHPKVFNAVHCSLVRAGESGGMLDEVLWRIVDFGEQEEELRGRTISALIYPAFLMFMGTAAVFILISFVFPKFTAVFEDFNMQLPWPTLVVMGVCDFMERFWWLVILAFIGAVMLAIKYYQTPGGRMRVDTDVLRIPVLGSTVLKYQISQFARVLGTLLDNGVPVLHSLKITMETLSNKAITTELDALRLRVAEGDSISGSLQQSRHFPPMVVSMFAVGEESGRLGAVTKRLAQAYDNEVDRAVRTLTAMMEPLMIVVMGVIIGFLVIAMLLPMLTLSAQVS